MIIILTAEYQQQFQPESKLPFTPQLHADAPANAEAAANAQALLDAQAAENMQAAADALAAENAQAAVNAQALEDAQAAQALADAQAVQLRQAAEDQIQVRCDQIITGRNFAYDRALEIVQDEEYLDDSDFDEIRLRHQKRSVDTKPTFPETVLIISKMLTSLFEGKKKSSLTILKSAKVD